MASQFLHFRDVTTTAQQPLEIIFGDKRRVVGLRLAGDGGEAVQRSHEEFADDLVARRAAMRGGFAATSFAQAEDGAAVDDEILLALAGIGVGAADNGAGHVHEVAIGPVVALEQGPEGNSGGIDFAVSPGVLFG
jgi:hypothetical protein